MSFHCVVRHIEEEFSGARESYCAQTAEIIDHLADILGVGQSRAGEAVQLHLEAEIVDAAFVVEVKLRMTEVEGLAKIGVVLFFEAIIIQFAVLLEHIREPVVADIVLGQVSCPSRQGITKICENFVGIHDRKDFIGLYYFVSRDEAGGLAPTDTIISSDEPEGAALAGTYQSLTQRTE